MPDLSFLFWETVNLISASSLWTTSRLNLLQQKSIWKIALNGSCTSCFAFYWGYWRLAKFKWIQLQKWPMVIVIQGFPIYICCCQGLFFDVKFPFHLYILLKLKHFKVSFILIWPQKLFLKSKVFIIMVKIIKEPTIKFMSHNFHNKGKECYCL